MPKITKTYNINSTQQLIDLNQDSKNFKLVFECKSHASSAKYQILVQNQSQLDTQDVNNLPYKQVSHIISGNIVADKNIYQNHFLVIRADKPCIVDITIDKEEIEPNIEELPVPVITNTNNTIHKNRNKKSFFKSSLFLWIVIAIIGCVLLYFIFFTKTDDLKNSSIIKHSVHGGSVHGSSVHGGSVHGSSVHGGSVHGSSVHGGSVHGSSVHGSSVHGSSVHGGSVHGSSVHGGSVHKRKKKKFTFEDFHM